jgi:DNA polymerase III subunit alpha
MIMRIFKKMSEASSIVISSERKYYYFFDTETTGFLPSVKSVGARPGLKNFHDIKHIFENHTEWREFNEKMPRILSFAGILTDEIGEKIGEDYNFRIPEYMKTDHTIGRIKISNSHIHGITVEKCDERGIPIMNILDQFVDRMKTYHPILVGHNIEFDLAMIVVEIINEYAHYPSKYSDIDWIIEYFTTPGNIRCTMEEGRNICKLILPSTSTPRIKRTRTDDEISIPIKYKQPKL